MNSAEPLPSRSPRAALGWILAASAFLAAQAYLLFCLAVWSGASLPYQDPPADLLQQQQHDTAEARRRVKTAAIVAAVSPLWLAVKVARARALRRRAKK
jgi:hypothetical protein